MIYKENDFELLSMIYENNEEAEEMFYNKYKSKIEITAKKYYSIVKSCGIELNDLIQEGMMGLTEAIKNYKDKKDVQFSTFANICIDRKILGFVRKNTNLKNKLLNNSLSIDTTLNSNGKPLLELLKDDNNINPEDISIYNEKYDEILKKANNILTKQEMDVFMLRLNGFTYQEISSLLNITKKSAERTMARVKLKLQKIID